MFCLELSLIMFFLPTMHWATKWLVGSELYNLTALLLETETKHGRKALLSSVSPWKRYFPSLMIHDPTRRETNTVLHITRACVVLCIYICLCVCVSTSTPQGTPSSMDNINVRNTV